MRTWLISGACRGVGKTFLAKHLCAVLPSSVYAKFGHGKPRRGKSAHYFTSEKELRAFVDACRGSYDHMVIESNAFGRRNRGDIRIFLEASRRASDLRNDIRELRSKADLCVSAEASRREWERVLKRHLDDPRLVSAVLDVLAEQQRWLSSSPLGVRSKIWFVNAESQHVIGSGLAQLLVEVEHLGSLQEAAKRMNIPYRRATVAIRKAEAHFGEKLIETKSSRRTGGTKLVLTPAGKRVLAFYLRLSEKVAAFADQAFKKAHGEALAEERSQRDST
jgi:molybdate transport system regulatory protein